MSEAEPHCAVEASLPSSRTPLGRSRAALFRDIHYNIPMSDSLIIAGRSFRSRLIVGTGKYKSFQETARALEAVAPRWSQSRCAG